MTKIHGLKRVAHETPALTRYRGARPIIVTITSAGLELRAKGTRQKYMLPFGIALGKAQELEADRIRAARKAARKAKRGL